MESLIIALIVLFLHSTTWDGMIFAGFKKIIPPDGTLYKPIYGCPICMTPWYGTALYIVFYHVSFGDWFLTVMSAAGWSVLFVCVLAVRDMCLAVENELTTS